jgi:signal transduction histidine kinase
MRNPLFGLQAVLDGLEGDCGQDESRRAFVALGQSQLSRLRRMTDDLLAYAAPPRFNRTRVHAARAIQDATDEIRDASAARGVTIVDEASSAGATLDADHARLVLALSHLLRNAIRRAVPGGAVMVRLTCVERDGARWCEIAVEDDGPPLDEATRTTIFEPFALRSGERTGLELAIVSSVAEQHSGRAGVEVRPSGGLRFFVALPVEVG